MNNLPKVIHDDFLLQGEPDKNGIDGSRGRTGLAGLDGADGKEITLTGDW